MSYAHHTELPGLFHLVELRARSGQTGPEEFNSRLLAVAALHGSIFRCGIQLWGYNILPDRVLLVVVPLRPRAIGPALMDADRFPGRSRDIRHRLPPFWQRAYSACPFADEVAWRVLRYVDVASMPDGGEPLDPHAQNSAAEHAGFQEYGLLTAPPERLPNPMAWRAFLFLPEDEQFVQALESCLRTGRPFGPPSFVRKVEETGGLRFRHNCLNRPSLFGNVAGAPAL